MEFEYANILLIMIGLGLSALIPILGILVQQIAKGRVAIENLAVQFAALNEKVASSYVTLARHEEDIKGNSSRIRETENRLNQRSGLPL